ncbi:uncharacterized protein N7515_004878 [Penicillium bovifimosum]|uniref:Piwi domain-containing protein n=1 Tax=Penicillium bovifimosum TaxID=126998 RepID=A0A9W9L2U5_9EURO|nr:uncharacterized protein N7515_004878 [Penicillium bovifimosum]KAJ5135600.1 hypothetical protein N7515_004878 [Penicillium bovifimosum]
MAPPKPSNTSDEEDERLSRYERRYVPSGTMGSSSSSSSSSERPMPLSERQVRELREYRANLAEEARRKKEAELTAWMRRTRIDPETGERKPKHDAGSDDSGSSPIRRAPTPPEVPEHWTDEEKANHERLIQEGLRVAVWEQHRMHKDKFVETEDYATIHWDECMNIDIPWHRFRLKTGKDIICKTPLDPRKGYNTAGREIEVMMNAYPITTFPRRAVYQYEVNVVQGETIETDRRILRKAWNSQVRKTKLPNAIWDGGQICWSTEMFSDWHEVVDIKRDSTRGDLNSGHGRKPKDVEKHGRWPGFRMSLVLRKKVDLRVIASWLRGRHDLDESVIESLSFLDHLLRETPTKKHAAIKRAFFFDKLDDMMLKQEFFQPLSNRGASVYRGIYQAIRPTPGGLILNVDVAHCVFFSRITLMGIMMHFGNWNDKEAMVRALQSTRDKWGGLKESPHFAKASKRIQGLRVTPNYEGCPYDYKSFIVKGLMHCRPRDKTINYTDKVTGITKNMNIEEYFMKRYNVRLEYPNMLMVEMQKENCYYPAEFLVIKGLQRYRWKLDDMQTAQMIQWCATKPQKRLANICQSKELLQHKNDDMLKHYGMEISEKMIKTKARLLPSPEIQFGGNAKLNPRHTGKWDLRGKKFYKPNEKALEAWGVGYFAGHRKGITHDQVLLWVEHFIKIYRQMGGEVDEYPLVKAMSEDVGKCVKNLYEGISLKFQREPQLMVWIVPNKDSWVYLRLKRSSDCRFGCPSQVLQSQHCIDNRPQYHANVLMKVNAKLGGVTARAIPKSKGSALPPKSMIIGADVTHPTLGVWTPSLAAMSVSANVSATRYMGGCEVNDFRVEVIKDKVVEDILKPMVAEWRATVGEGSLRNVEEVPSVKNALAHACGRAIWEGRMCVIVANKRHHLRAFPNPNVRANCDPHGGPLPGTLVDRDVTSAHDWDFLLYTHIALQGTARPVHYHVLMDEIGLNPNDLEGMINDHCYQYIRSTTSVSVHPAIYYAHLISVRARHHEDIPITAGPQSGVEVPTTNPKPKEPRAERLLPIAGTSNRLALGMWYI